MDWGIAEWFIDEKPKKHDTESGTHEKQQGTSTSKGDAMYLGGFVRMGLLTRRYTKISSEALTARDCSRARSLVGVLIKKKTQNEKIYKEIQFFNVWVDGVFQFLLLRRIM